jgi:hypothetical protein
MSLVYTAPVATTGVRRNSVYIGGRADAKSLEKLERWGISHILNVSPPKEAAIQVRRQIMIKYWMDFAVCCCYYVYRYRIERFAFTIVSSFSFRAPVFVRLAFQTSLKRADGLSTSAFQSMMHRLVLLSWKAKPKRLPRSSPKDYFMGVFWCIVNMASRDRPRAS